MPLQPRRAALWLAVAVLTAGGHQLAHAAEPAAPAAAQVREEELLLFAVELDSLTIADTLAAYGDPLDPLLPLGELARLLDLNVTVLPGDGRITGRIGEAQRALTVDLGTGLARVGGRDIALAPADVAVTASEIYMRASAVSRLLPLDIAADPEALTLKLTPRETLPIQARLERIARLRELRPEVDSPEAVLRVETPYRLYSPPAFDVAIATAHDTRPPHDPRRYDIRVGADVLYTGFQGYLGSDDDGQPAAARILFERHDVRGGLLGPINATSATAGDTFTPAMPIGPRSVGGRGFAFTTAPLEQASVFSRIDLRGELPLGYDVELYVNDILRSGQRTPVEGRYEFLQVPLARGLNVIRIVSYGPRGERSEQTRVINVGGGQLKPGQTTFDFGVVQQETPVIELSGDDGGLAGPAEGKARVVALLTRGITEKLTMTAGGAYYPDADGQDRGLLTIGARTSLAGLAVLADAAGDDQGGFGLALGLAGQPWGLSIIGRHAEYSGGFVDEANPAIQLGKPLIRHSEVTIDTSLKPGGRSIPLSLRAARDAYDDGGQALLAAARASTTFGTVLVSGGLDYRRDDNNDQVNKRLTGVLAASTFAAYRWQLRGALDYEVEPEARFSALTLTADRALTERTAVRFGLGHSFGEEEDTTALQAAVNFKLPYGDLAVAGDYVAPDSDWRVGVQFAFGLVHDPFGGRYRMTRPGPASGGNVSFQAFIDRDGDGVFDPGEEPVSGVTLSGAEHPVTTTANGRAFITGMGVTPTARVQVGLEEIDNPFVQSPPHTVEFAPRMGGVTRVSYPLVPTGEVMARILYVQPDGRLVGLSAVHVRITREGGQPVEGTTEFDGSVAFDALPAGIYRLELDSEQAERLRMRLKSPVSFTVDPDGGYVADVQAEVVFEKGEG